MKYGFNSKFKRLLKDPTVKFTVILGSGWHKQAVGNKSILSSWSLLLRKIDPTFISTGFYPLDYESIILKRTESQSPVDSSSEQASQIENKLSQEICEKLKRVQKKTLKNKSEKYYSKIFNPNKISDVIPLNFDTIAEDLCRLNAGKDSLKQTFELLDSESKEFKIYYSSIEFKELGSINFWYPHGSIIDKNKIILGTREYGKAIEKIERMRINSKSKKNRNTWYHKLTSQPVIILGADMNKDELDLWFAFVNRERNYSKPKVSRFKQPVFQMRECDCENRFQNKWFLPLAKGMNFKQQWEELEKLLII